MDIEPVEARRTHNTLLAWILAILVLIGVLLIVYFVWSASNRSTPTTVIEREPAPVVTPGPPGPAGAPGPQGEPGVTITTPPPSSSGGNNGGGSTTPGSSDGGTEHTPSPNPSGGSGGSGSTGTPPTGQ